MTSLWTFCQCDFDHILIAVIHGGMIWPVKIGKICKLTCLVVTIQTPPLEKGEKKHLPLIMVTYIVMKRLDDHLHRDEKIRRQGSLLRRRKCLILGSCQCRPLRTGERSDVIRFKTLYLRQAQVTDLIIRQSPHLRRSQGCNLRWLHTSHLICTHTCDMYGSQTTHLSIGQRRDLIPAQTTHLISRQYLDIGSFKTFYLLYAKFINLIRCQTGHLRRV